MAYTTIDDPSVYFQTALWSGDDATTQNITNDGNSDLQPDWVWVKNRTDARWHRLVDSSRGASKNLYSNETDAEGTEASVTAFNSDGFSLGTDTGSDGWNENGDAHVAWQWKANGGSRTTFNASGNQLAGGYQANTTAGFSIVDYTGNATNGATFPHGLGATPVIAIIKDRTNAGDGGGTNWIVAYTIQDGSSDRLYLNGTNAKFDLPVGSTEFRVDFDSSNVTLGTWNNVNASGTHIAYVFTPIQGYSKFGSYTGNANADGAFVYTGFKPAWIMIKKTNNTSQWVLHDTTRQEFNMQTKFLQANQSAAESTSSAADLDILSNGFKLRSSDDAQNGNGDTYIYMAFAESPFVSPEGVATTAR